MDRAVCNKCQFFFWALWWIYSNSSKASGCSEEVGLVTRDGCTCFRGNSHEGASGWSSAKDLDSQFDPFNAWLPVHLHDEEETPFSLIWGELLLSGNLNERKSIKRAVSLQFLCPVIIKKFPSFYFITFVACLQLKKCWKSWSLLILCVFLVLLDELSWKTNCKACHLPSLVSYTVSHFVEMCTKCSLVRRLKLVTHDCTM